MEIPPELPPVLPAPAMAGAGSPPSDLPPVVQPIPAWRGWALLLLMASYPLLLELIGALTGAKRQQGDSAPVAMLPETIGGLWASCGMNLGIFGALFFVAWAVARPSAGSLYLRRSSPWAALGWGVAWSIVLRIVVAGMVLTVMGGFWIWARAHGKEVGSLDGFRPKIENVITPSALHDPLYLLMILTVVSFVVAGLREELWRAAMIAGVLSLLPERWQGRRGEALAIGIAAIVFGLGHLPQGAGGVLLTGFLGIGLGAVLVGHRSLWIAVLAHGFFDATSFFGLWAADRAGLLKQLLHP